MKKRLFSLVVVLAMILSLAPVTVLADPDEGNPSAEVQMLATSVGGINYYYANTEGIADDADYVFSVTTGRGANAVTTEYRFKKAELTQVGETSWYYVPAPGATPLTGTLYGYGAGTKTTYKDVYAAMGVSTDDSYDVVSSATNFTSRHAGDIPSLTVIEENEDGSKAITGVSLNREAKTVEAETFVEASILKAAGAELTEDEAAALDITLKVNPMKAPSENVIPAKFAKAEYTNSKYGTGEINIYPDETVEGYAWSEYMDNIYAATISNGTDTAGSVFWIDLYGEKATSGPHYNKVEFELNNGYSKADNEAEVHRFAAFFNEDGSLKQGTYKVSIYSEGYDVVSGEITIGISLKDKTAAFTGEPVSIDPAEVSGITGEIAYTYYSDAECKNALEGAPSAEGVYYIKASYGQVVSNTATLRIGKLNSSVTLQPKSSVYTGENINIDAAKVTGSTGKVTYYYYSDSACRNAVSEHKNVGTYYVKATVEADENYKSATSNVVTLTITKGSSTITLKGKKETFTGKNISIGKAEVSGSTGKVTYTYYSDAGCTKKVTAHKNAGTYYVKATVAEDSNCRGATSKAVTLVIIKAENPMTAKAKASSFTASATAKTVFSAKKVFSVTNAKGKVSYKKSSGNQKITVASNGKITVKKGLTKGKTYTVKVKVTAKGTNNYKSKTKTVTLKFKIKK